MGVPLTVTSGLAVPPGGQFGYHIMGEPPCGQLEQLGMGAPLVTNLGNLVWRGPSSQFGERPLVADFSNLTWEHPLVANHGNKVKEQPMVVDLSMAPGG